MPQTRKRKSKEKVGEEIQEKERKTSISSSNPRKRKNNENSSIPELTSFKNTPDPIEIDQCSGSSSAKSTDIKIKKNTPKKEPKSRKTKVDLNENNEKNENRHSALNASLSNTKGKSKRHKSKNSLSPRKDAKLKKANVVLHDLKGESQFKDYEKFHQSHNFSGSGMLSETTSGTKLNLSIKSNLSKDLPNSKIPESSNESSSESEWEEVKENSELNLDDYKPEIPKEGVIITVDCPDLHIRKRVKKKFDENEWIRLHVNRIRKDIQLSIHKTHLLCLLGHGFYVNKVLNSDTIKALALSVIPENIFSITSSKKLEKIGLSAMERIIFWFQETFTFVDGKSLFLNLFSSLVKNFQDRKSLNPSEYNLMFIAISRILGFNVRFCISLYPMSYKATNLIKKQKNKENSVETKPKEKVRENSTIKKEKKEKIQVKGKESKISKPVKKKQDCSDIETNEKEKVDRPRRSKSKSYKISSDEEDIDDDDFIVQEIISSDEDDKKPSISPKPKTMPHKNKSNRKVLSSDSEAVLSPSSDSDPNTIVCWAEIFLKSEKQWISVDCVNNCINKPHEIEEFVRNPVSYIMAFDNESYVKDVTRRYCNNYMITTLKLRVDPDWWEETLEPFSPPNSKLNKEEEKKLDEMLVNKPLPHTVQGFKNHPLYALKRHLLKFEGIYPPDAPTVGFMRGEPIYARDCVHQLHSRETWLKEARVVRIGEQPYKIVKARPKWDKIASVLRTDLPLEIFGIWQTEPYEPPIAVDGKVPRNEYGNVELFKPCMLPRGTVHLQLPGLNRIAKKLGIDCSAAVVGFDGHKGSVHPVFDGFIICEEFKETIIAAWDEEQENIKKREEEKREKRIYGNWKKLIKGLLIRERIQLKYHSEKKS